MNIQRTLRMLGARYRARITKGTTAAENNGAAIKTARAQRTDDDVAGVMDQKQLEALVAKLTDTASTIATTQALDEGRRIGAGLVEVKLRLRLVKNLHDHGVDIPNKADVVASLETQQRELKDAEQATISEQLATAAASGLATWMDEKSAHNRARKLERERRTANGDCVDCPKKRLRRAAPGSTRCDECGKDHNTRNRDYRQRGKEGAGGGSTKGPTKKNVGRRRRATARQRAKGGGRRKPQSEMARNAIDGPGNAEQAERERGGLDGEVPYRREQNRDVSGEQKGRPILGDTFGERADADETQRDAKEREGRRGILDDTFGEGAQADKARSNVGGGPRVRATLANVFRVPLDADQSGSDLGGTEDRRKTLVDLLGEADDGQETEPQPSDVDDESPRGPG